MRDLRINFSDFFANSAGKVAHLPAGGPPFHATQTKAVEFPGAALFAPLFHAKGAGLDATSPSRRASAPFLVRAAANYNRMMQRARATDHSAAPICYASPAPQLRTLAYGLPAAGRRECGTRNYKSKR